MAIQQLTAEFDIAKLIGKVGQNAYLGADYRLLWMHSIYGDAASIQTEMLQYTPISTDGKGALAIFKATITIITDGGLLVYTGHGSETQGDFNDYMEKAETKAISRALEAAGFGTLAAQSTTGELQPQAGAPRQDNRQQQRGGNANQSPPRAAPAEDRRPAPQPKVSAELDSHGSVAPPPWIVEPSLPPEDQYAMWDGQCEIASDMTDADERREFYKALIAEAGRACAVDANQGWRFVSLLESSANVAAANAILGQVPKSLSEAARADIEIAYQEVVTRMSAPRGA